jgi:hypothetical protein
MIRLASQVALSTWAITEVAMLLYTRKRLLVVVGVRWAIFGLACFALWMFLSSISIYATAVIPRGDLVNVFASLELGTAIGAWGWLICNVHARFRIVAGNQ